MEKFLKPHLQNFFHLMVLFYRCTKLVVYYNKIKKILQMWL